MIYPTRIFQTIWKRFCQLAVWVFYHNCEVNGIENIPANGPVLLCANHANALVDAIIIQAIQGRLVQPLARSGLFNIWLLKPVMAILEAVPVYRRQDNAGQTKQNIDSFQKCYEIFQRNGLILIFPEGQSHSDTKLRPIKTGAARISLGALELGIPLSVIPIGLNFTNKGKFRSDVFVKVGNPVELENYSPGQDEDTVRQLTAIIQDGIESVTINVDEVAELEFLRNIERFFALRHGKYRQRDLNLRFRALKKLGKAYQQLHRNAPARVEELKKKLSRYERLCQNWNVNTYHITLRYTPVLISKFILRICIIFILIMPAGVWGLLNNYLPYVFTRILARHVSSGEDQYDTAKMITGIFLFGLFWSVQVWWVYTNFSPTWAMLYAASLPLSAAAALLLRRERQLIWDRIRVFSLFVRKRKLKIYLEEYRKELERDLAMLVRLAKQVAQNSD